MSYVTKNTPKRIGLYTQNLVKPVFKARGLLEGKIISSWPQIVGEKFSKQSIAQKIIFPKGKRTQGTLYLSVTSSSAFLLEHAQDLIIERVNTFFGYKAIEKLRMMHDFKLPKPSEKTQSSKELANEDIEWLESLTNHIEDQELRTYLENLGKGVCKPT